MSSKISTTSRFIYKKLYFMNKNFIQLCFFSKKKLIHFLLPGFFNMQTFYSQAITVPVNFAIHNFSANSKKNHRSKGPLKL
jgi:hypothetical protein